MSNSLNQTKKAPLQEVKGFFQRAGNEIGRNFKDMSRTAVKTAENTVIKPMRRESYVKKKKKSSDLYRIGYISLVNIKVTKAPSKSIEHFFIIICMLTHPLTYTIHVYNIHHTCNNMIIVASSPLSYCLPKGPHCELNAKQSDWGEAH